MNNFENKQLNRIIREEEKGLEREKMKELNKFLYNIAENLHAEGLPVKEDGRIDESGFTEIYPEKEIQNDIKRINYYKSQWGEQENRKETNGEKLEMLKTAIFNKFLGEKFIITRSTEIDDVDNKVDNVIVEKETGNIVSAFDEISEINDYRYKEKVEKIMERNKNGASLKYGLSLDKNGEIKPSSKIEHIPLFYLALPQKQIEEGIKNFKMDSISEYEKKLFEYFILSIETQMKGLELRNDSHPECQKKLKQLEASLKHIK
jgi:vacuolar-type H+-ATPase subunit I/STV1